MGVCTSKQGSIVHATITVQPYSENGREVSFAELPIEPEPVTMQTATHHSRQSYHLRTTKVDPNQKTFRRALSAGRLVEDQNNISNSASTRKQKASPWSSKKDRETSQTTNITMLSDDESTFSLDIENESLNNDNDVADPETMCRELISKLTSNNTETRDKVQSLLSEWEKTNQASLIKSHARSASADIANDHHMLAEYLTRDAAKYVQNLDTSENHQVLLAKAFAIYSWICTNIGFDAKLWERYISEKLFKKESLVEMEAAEVLSSRATICAGYANLFAEMAEIAGLQVEVVQGEVSHIPFPAVPADSTRASAAVPHTWNVIKVDNVWFAVDCTLGACYCDRRDVSAVFKPNYNRHFFATTPPMFILTHWPNDTCWQLLQSTIEREELDSLIIFPFCAFSRGIRPLTWNRSIKLGKTQKSTTIELIAQPTKKIGAKLVYMGKDIGKCQEIQTNSSNLIHIQRNGEVVSIKAALPFKGTYSLLLSVNQENKKTLQVFLSYHITCMNDSTEEMGYPKVYEMAAAAFEFRLVYWTQSLHDCVCETETGELSLVFKAKRGMSCSHFLIPGKTRNTRPTDHLSVHYYNTMIVGDTSSNDEPNDQEESLQMLKVVFPEEGWWTICLNGTKGNPNAKTHGGYVTLMSYHVFAKKGNSVSSFPYIQSPIVSFCNTDPIPSISESVEVPFTTLKPLDFQAYIVETKSNARELASYTQVEEAELVAVSPNQYMLKAIFPKPGKWYVRVFGCEKENTKDEAYTSLFSLLVDVEKPMSDAIAVSVNAKIADKNKLQLLDKGFICFPDDGQPLVINFECGKSRILFRHQIRPEDPDAQSRLKESGHPTLLEHCTYLAPLHNTIDILSASKFRPKLLSARSQTQPVLPTQNLTESMPMFRLHAAFPWSGKWTVEFYAKAPADEEAKLAFHVTLNVSKPSKGICYPILHPGFHRLGINIPEQFISYSPICGTTDFELPFNAPTDIHFAWNIEVAGSDKTYTQQGFVHQFGNRNPSHHFLLSFCTPGLWKAQLFAASAKSEKSPSERDYKPVLEISLLVDHDNIDREVSYPELFPAFKKYGLSIAKTHLPLISRVTNTHTNIVVPFFSPENVKFWHRIEPAEGSEEECQMMTQMVSNTNSGLYEISVKQSQPGTFWIMLWAQPAESKESEWDPVLRHTVECVC